ncbi:hypothetical protein HOLleu_06879 [Holothuria leucospilota]|uniref:Uncharacterized protein n=1 Tax=Holothuria leucospilota TaxID=206669 RepID=A0A9Q1CM14_HOLLE|nr:hypothetical protein HOLleu_06879 [Holothuria leucospilota]
MGLTSLCSHLENKHIKIMCDNSTAVSYINAMGRTHSVKCNNITKKIWLWCIQRDIWLTCRFLPGKTNTKADSLSRRFNSNTEWMLDPSVFQKITAIWGEPDIDLFASSLNHGVTISEVVTPCLNKQPSFAFSVTWTDYFFYAFPPFSMIHRCLHKIQKERATGILIAPKWPTQAWLTMLLNMPRIRRGGYPQRKPCCSCQETRNRYLIPWATTRSSLHATCPVSPQQERVVIHNH